MARVPALFCVASAVLGACEPAAEAPTTVSPSEAPSVLPSAPRLVREDRSDLPIAGLDVSLARLFARGDARFEEPFVEAQGLGPLYLQRSCEGCHEDDLRGPGVVQRFTPPGLLGDTVRPRRAAGARVAITVPEGARVSTRLPPAVIARGWLEALDDATLEGWARAQAEEGGPIHGIPSRPDTSSAPASIFGDRAPRLGRFGHKARAATLEAFVVDALLGDMGLTSPERPVELPNPDGLTDDARPGLDVDADTVVALAAYVRLLALPARPPPDERGARVFEEVGCARCHVPSARTRADHPIEALRDREVALYTDVLLHDMGTDLDDGVTEGDADGRHWRTAPLVGTRFVRALLHDGRAEDVAAAIAAHGSEGSEALEVIARLEARPPEERAALVRFVEGL